jgi:DNA-binding transcriptional LysR family regulator
MKSIKIEWTLIESMIGAVGSSWRMNVHYLELFYYVARHGGISRAVRVMPYGIQQPAVSSQMIRLEKDLGVSLFRRRPFELTREGEELFAFVRPFFSRLGEVEESLRHGTRFLRIGATETVIRDYLPGPLQHFRRAFPEVRLSLRSGATSELLDLLTVGDLDLVVGPTMSGLPSGLVMERLIELRLALLVPESVAERTAAGFMRKHAGSATLITLPLEEPLTRVFRDELARRGIDWTPALELASLDLVQSYAAGGFGVGLSIDAPALPRPEGVKLLPLARFPKLEIAAFHGGKIDVPASSLLSSIREGAKVLQRPGRKGGRVARSSG